jgi:excisionase family DNA binding protein
MNLADAIRQAASAHDQPPVAAMQVQAQTEALPEEADMEQLSAPEGAPAQAEFRPPEHPGASAGNVVRFELFLDAAQMNSLLRALMSSHHNVMTLREAAAYIRLPAATLEEMALNHELPAFQVEGKWRFPKVAVDEWLMVQSMKTHMGDENAA